MCLPQSAQPARVAYGSTLAGDPYSVALAIGELVLRDAGWDAQSLGSSLPLDTIEQTIRDYEPRLFWMSASYIADEQDFEDSVNRVFAAASEHGTALAIGGRAIDPDLRERLKYHTFCNTFQDT